jgi:hypothetical protein
VAVSSVDVKKSGTLHVDTTSGYGSTGVTARTWTNASLGTADFIYTDNATDGSAFTCAWPGVYTMAYTDQFNAVETAIISKNGDATALISAAYIAASSSPAANRPTSCTAAGSFKVGDVVLTQTGTTPNGADPTASHFFITRNN